MRKKDESDAARVGLRRKSVRERESFYEHNLAIVLQFSRNFLPNFRNIQPNSDEMPISTCFIFQHQRFYVVSLVIVVVATIAEKETKAMGSAVVSVCLDSTIGYVPYPPSSSGVSSLR